MGRLHNSPPRDGLDVNDCDTSDKVLNHAKDLVNGGLEFPVGGTLLPGFVHYSLNVCRVH